MVLAMLVATGASAQARNPSTSPDCFDALISARIVKQTPTIIPGCGQDCIVMEWPWIVEFEVHRVVRGVAPMGRLKVLTMQHTYRRADTDARLWWLRRNAQGGFNALWLGPHPDLPLCRSDAPPAKPYIRPAARQTLDDLEIAGENYYGPHR